jgi:UDP:flavonoid glycosyltransferase YjiC (YdhE family)
MKSPVMRVQVDLPGIPEVLAKRTTFPDGRMQARLSAQCEFEWRNMVRKEGLDLGPNHIKRIRESVRKTVPTIALWPSWVLKETQTPHGLRTFGFIPPPTIPESSDLPFDDGSDRRLIVFAAGTMGTTESWMDQYLTVSIEVCRRFGCKGVLLGGKDPSGQNPFPGWFSWRESVPLARILPRAAAIVHHGGIGAAASALKHGIPQLIVPRVFMQPTNAEWCRRLGICATLNPTGYSVANVMGALEGLLSDQRYKKRSVELSTRFDSQAEISRVCNFLESWKRACPPPRIAEKLRQSRKAGVKGCPIPGDLHEVISRRHETPSPRSASK